tara:strand:- start:823 stop:1683 length:861 start_codon:yes stop_codon:yes gene_type:complete
MVHEFLAFFQIPWIAAFTAVFFWWFLTGLILFIVKKVDEINQNAHKFVTLIFCPVFFLGVYLYFTSLSNISLSSIYSAFFGSLLIWSWFELAFLSGFITGPSKELCPQGIDQIKRFSHAISTIAYSELLLFITLSSMVYLSIGAINTVGLWTFGILFFARICAKLNLFLGVPSINTEFLPSPVVHLASYFKVGSTSWFFPISISLISFTLFFLVDNIFDVENQISTTIGFTLLASLTTLALIEHWFMVVPLRDAELWKWMLPKQKKQLKLKKSDSENYISEKIHGL